MVAEFQRKRKEVVKEVERLRAETHDGGIVESWNETKKLRDELKELKGDELTAAQTTAESPHCPDGQGDCD